MGLLAKIKQLFNKNIECDEIDNHLVFFLNKKYLYLNKYILVRDNSLCVVTYKSRVCDVLLPGKYKINEQSLPELFYRARINDCSHRSRKVRKIRCKLFFVNTRDNRHIEFYSDNPFVTKSNNIGRIKGLISGTCNIKVLDGGLLVKSLLAKCGKVKNSKLENAISLWVGNRVNKCIQKNKIKVEELMGNNSFVNSIVGEKLEDGFDKLGLFATNFKLKAVNFSKHSKKKFSKYFGTSKTISTPKIANSDWRVTSDKVKVETVTGQNANVQKINKQPLDLNGLVRCSKCGHFNNKNAKICSKCNSRI